MTGKSYHAALPDGVEPVPEGVGSDQSTVNFDADPATACLTWMALGSSFLEKRQYEKALACYEAANECLPDLSGVAAARGVVLFRLGRHQEALDAYTAALTLQPDDADVWLNMGVLYHADGYFTEAISCFDVALKLRPAFDKAWSNRAKALRAIGEFEAAITHFDRSLEILPGDFGLMADRGMCRLMLGDYAAGWRDYEARLLQNAEPRVLRGLAPQWNGEPLSGKRIVVHAEQGLGDILQFSRALEDLNLLGATVTLNVTAPMIPLLSGLVSPCALTSDVTPDQPFDFEVALISLPYRLGLSASPRHLSPLRYLRSSPDRSEVWARRLAIGRDGFRIGITWQGNPDFIDDRQRSIPLGAFATITDVPGIRLISLQAVHGLQQLDELACDLDIEWLGEIDRLGAFVDTAAIMDNLDLIITSDTAIAHLAGALGRPVWLALARVPDWRWGLSGETTHWYPSMRLFRQTTDGDWDGVFAAIRAALMVEMADA